MKHRTFFCLIISSLVLVSCASFLKYEKEDQLKKNEEFDKKVKIEEPAAATTTSSSAVSHESPTAVPKATAPIAAKSDSSKKVSKKDSKRKKGRGQKAEKIQAVEESEKASSVSSTGDSVPAPTAPVATGSATPSTESTGTSQATTAPGVPMRRQPEIEDDAGFDGRRPLVDPFRVGEEVVHDVNYFKVSAGTLRMMVKPFVNVNGRKAYSFRMAINTSSLFSTFYSVDDSVDIFMDYETLVPSVFELHVKESGQLREAKMLFNDQDHTATFWEKKVTKDDGVEEKKQNWEIPPFAQNVYSAVYYMRFFKWEVGKEYSYHVANDKENLTFSGKALRKEVLDTKLGPMKAIVIQPNIMLKGKFKPIGENLMWLSDDEHRYILRIEAKIKIGTLVSEVVEIK